jgi:hypothetical protein
MRRHLILIPLAVLTLALGANAAHAFDVEYSTTGAMDTPATQGGDRDGWGSDFITRWHNDTGRDVLIEEFGWPCGGWWSQFWYVWIRDTLPAAPWGLEYYGSFVALSEDETAYPPGVYTYVDISAEGIVIPAGATMYFGYGNPGMGGHILFNGVETWSWLDGPWDMDGDFGRTAVMQFRGSYADASAADDTPAAPGRLGAHPNPFNPRTTISFSLPRDMHVSLQVYALDGRPVRRLVDARCAAGPHSVVWDGRDAGGQAVAAGAYLLRLVRDDGVEVSKLTLVK